MSEIRDKFIYPGSFNPLHAGHLNILHYLEEYDRECDIWAEICTCPIGKPVLTDNDVMIRANQFLNLGRSVVVTDSSTFIGKAIALREKFGDEMGLTFAAGYDTIVRIDDPKYYYDSVREKDRVLAQLYNLGCDFMVFPRNGKLDEGLSERMRLLCTFADNRFVESPISSSDIREGKIFSEQDILNHRIKSGEINFAQSELGKYGNRKDFS